MNYPPLKALHPDSSLIATKLAQMDRLSTDVLKASLKARLDGTMLDGHHRIYILRQRGVDVDTLPREISIKRSV